MRISSPQLFIAVAVAAGVAATVGLSATSGLTVGKAEVKSAGPLAFGPDGILFVGDSLGAAIFAIDTEDTKEGSPASVDIKGVN
jgi:hypothetical protein